jgi:hypothetical protein
MTEREGKSALFGPAPKWTAKPARDEGRRAVFSAPPRRKGNVVVECEQCGAHTPVPLVEIPVRLFPSLWIPGRTYSRLMRCPAGGHAAWCRIHWRAALD